MKTHSFSNSSILSSEAIQTPKVQLRWITLLFIAIAGLLSSCTLTEKNQNPISIEPKKDGTKAEIRIINNTVFVIDTLYVALSTDQGWNSNWLGTKTLAPGDTFTINDMPPDTYDVKAIYFPAFIKKYTVFLTAGQLYTWTLINDSLRTTDYGMKFIPGGTFLMGSTANTDEQPHSVTVSPFFMDSTEVTQNEYDWRLWVNPSYFDTNTYGPVERVTWFDAVLYCNARSKRDYFDTVYSYTSVTDSEGYYCTSLDNLTIDLSKNGYRLPTEAEWEYACRGGTTTDYFWGDAGGKESYAWDSLNSGAITSPVAAKLPNAYKLYDMSGNVFEWCNDWYEAYPGSGQTDPTGPVDGTDRVLRGGSWNSGITCLRSAYRGHDVPASISSRNGFRVVLPLR